MIIRKYIKLVVNSGQTIQYLGLSTGTSVNLLGIDSDGNTIKTTNGGGGGGTSGTSGSSGSSGANGTSGINGINGTSGTDGTSGIDGTSGVNGLDGTSGTDGTSGINGIDGTSGINGTSGVNGIDGTSGTNGTSGVNGLDGTSGINGTSGVNGIDGTSGTNGTSGVNGLDGTSGTDGTSGLSFNWNGSWNFTSTYNINDIVEYDGSSYISLTNGNSGTPPPPLNSSWALMSQAGDDGTSFNWTGTWNNTTTYQVNDVIFFNGSSYICIQTNYDINPDDGDGPLYWQLMSSAGTSGTDGTSGTSSSGTTWGSITGTLSSQTDLQDALDDKQDTLLSGINIKTLNNVTLLGSGNINSNPRTLSNVVGSNLIGTSNQISATVLIPANTISTNNSIYIRNLLTKTAGSTTSTGRIYINTTNSLSGATLMGTAGAMTSTTYIQRFERNFFFDGTNLNVYNPSNGISTDLTSGTRTLVSFDPTIDYYLLFAVQNSTTTPDNLGHKRVIVQIYE